MTTGFARQRTPNTACEPQYLCRHCDAPGWRPGGNTRFGQHLAAVHGIDVGPFPRTVHVDMTGLVVDWEGNPVMQRVGRVNRRATPPTDGIDGLIRSAPLKYHYGGSS